MTTHAGRGGDTSRALPAHAPAQLLTQAQLLTKSQAYREGMLFGDPQINLYVADVDDSVRFYRDLFGFAETFRTPRDGKPIHVEMRLGGLILGVASMESAHSIHGLDPGSGPPRGEVVLWTDDVDAAFASITARGARPLSEPHNFLADLRAAWVADPDGNPVQMVMHRGGAPSQP